MDRSVAGKGSSTAITRRGRPETMGDRIQSLIAAYNRTRSATTKPLKNQTLSLIVSDGKNPDVVRDILKRERAGDLDAGLTPERLLRIARFFGVTPTYLRTGKDDVDAFNAAAPPFPVGRGQPVIDASGLGSDSDTVEINGLIYRASDVRGEISIPDFILASLAHNARRDCVHWFDVAGDSMEPTLRAGDWVAVNIDDKRVGQGGVYALRDQHGTIIIKRLEYGDEQNRIDIISDNPRQQRKSELIGDITLIGRVITRITRVG